MIASDNCCGLGKMDIPCECRTESMVIDLMNRTRINIGFLNTKHLSYYLPSKQIRCISLDRMKLKLLLNIVFEV